ncbi:MAG TPA: type II secretion system F family protein [Fimbriimonas sp.]
MPFFRYSVQDPRGSVLEGTVSAKTADEASFTLSQRGLRVLEIYDVRQQKPVPQVRVAAPASRAQAAPPVAVAASSPSTVRTRSGSNRALFLLFSQLASMLRSGVNPHTGLTSLANNMRHPGYKRSLEEAARVAAGGGTLSSVFERYPYLYPPDVVGTVRCGELGGFLPEACMAVSTQKEAAHRLSFRLKIYSTMALGMIAIFPISLAIVRGSLATIKRQDEAGGSLPRVGTLVEELGKSIPQMIPPTLLAGLVLLLLYLGWHTLPMRKARHGLALYLPVFGGRARSEALARFAWAMQRLSRAGLPPYQVFRHAAETIPNVVLRDRLIQQADGMKEQEKLSDGLRRANVFPEEHEMIVANGELVGDVPGALATIASAQEAELQGREGTMFHRFAFLLYPVLGLLVIVLTYTLYKTFYEGLQSTILGE